MPGGAEISNFQLPGNPFIPRDIGLEFPLAGFEVGGLCNRLAGSNTDAR